MIYFYSSTRKSDRLHHPLTVCAKDERNSIKNFALYEFLCKFAINIHLKRIAYDIKNMITTG